MSEKIKLNNKTVFEISNASENSNILMLEFTNIEISALRKIFDKPYNLSTIEILTEGGATCGVYSGYTKVDKYISEIANESSVIKVYLLKPSETEKRLELLENITDVLLLSEFGVTSDISIGDKIHALFNNGKLDEINLDMAVKKHWISEEEKKLFIDSKKA